MKVNQQAQDIEGSEWGSEMSVPHLFVGQATKGTHSGEWLVALADEARMVMTWVNLDNRNCQCGKPECIHLALVDKWLEQTMKMGNAPKA